MLVSQELYKYIVICTCENNFVNISLVYGKLGVRNDEIMLLKVHNSKLLLINLVILGLLVLNWENLGCIGLALITVQPLD